MSKYLRKALAMVTVAGTLALQIWPMPSESALTDGFAQRFFELPLPPNSVVVARTQALEGPDVGLTPFTIYRANQLVFTDQTSDQVHAFYRDETVAPAIPNRLLHWPQPVPIFVQDEGGLTDPWELVSFSISCISITVADTYQNSPFWKSQRPYEGC